MRRFGRRLCSQFTCLFTEFLSLLPMKSLLRFKCLKKFEDEESWTQFLSISFHDLQLNCDFSNEMLKYYFSIRPLFLSKDGDTLVLHSHAEEHAILYNWRDHRVERSGVSVHKTVSTC
ncbi:F-box protein, partial [Trifolium pratense]